jgi:hypothetical protein
VAIWHRLEVPNRHYRPLGQIALEAAEHLGEGRALGVAEPGQRPFAETACLGVDHVVLAVQGGPWEASTLATVASLVPEVHGIPVSTYDDERGSAEST